ncbi:caspase family protein [Roseomonas sp. NAR14]|uniref:Caspase family protein n=1 Tax=Roseomonas acroporae TaxID=2937791 RepID=A0A9X1YBT2_9PROT|nr:caspase family protein [Roseomonas acroporae]MCK8787879.1 caspase family protein [Roseomonas acroporae]
MRWLLVVCLALLPLGTPVPAMAQGAGAQPGDSQPVGRRVALVVGIGAYERQSRLLSTPNDARSMGATLQALGFELVGGGPLVDPDKQGFEQAIRAFGDAARGAEAALFYFSGHGTQVDGRNWMVPPRGNARTPQDLPFEFVDVGLVLNVLQGAAPRLGFVILDACRSNPFRPGTTRDSRQGLAPMQAPPGMVIAYAAEPDQNSLDGGNAALNSPYTAQLLRAIRTPGLDLFRVFNTAALRTREQTRRFQSPWVSFSPIEADFYFMPRGLDPARLPPLPPLSPNQPGAAPETGPGTPPGSGAPDSPAAPVRDPSFLLVNRTGRPIAELRASLSTNDNWGAERLGGTPLAAGARTPVQLPRGSCEVDLQARFAGAPQIEAMRVDTCRFATMVLWENGRLLPANPDLAVVNGTARRLRDLRVSLSSDRNWGANRIADGAPLSPGGKVEVRLPHGVTCDVDLRAEFDSGAPVERRVDACAITELRLQ